MRLLSKKPKTPKAARVICPSCGKPNQEQPEVAMPRCVLCNGILPSMQAPKGYDRMAVVEAMAADGTTGAGTPSDGPVDTMFSLPAPSDTSPLESFDASALQYTQFAQVPQGPTAVPTDAPAAIFDTGVLQVGEPAGPQPSSNDQ